MSNFKGHIVKNSFLESEKFAEHYQWFKTAADKFDAELEILGNADILSGFETENDKKLEELIHNDDFIIFWDKDIRFGSKLEQICHQNNILMCNSIESIAICDDKAETYFKFWEYNQKAEALNMKKISLIPTLVAPMTYPNIGYTDTSFLDNVIDTLGLPIVVKECSGSFGEQVYLAETKEILNEIVQNLSGIPHIYQKFVKESCGRDVRLQVVGNRVVAAMYRYSVNGDFRANVTGGAHTKPYNPSDTECELAVKAVNTLGLDFGGVDMLFSGKDSEADILCEVNSNAHFKNMYICTGVDVADEIMKYIIFAKNILKNC